ncbi:cobyrinate a,c-diamide synthase [Paracidobacterium acidisoli]|uniref:Cobyrinate a,c-diamide synthase n=1 Tax=Paracidobacterium acidisoli TaxID=2303751 RepID=A0A372IPX7_9BACT|nr:cobyrinate a,c-diamide synthase [Paracidobacterium acidisoli]MBT9331259.1 cobyrinate a,c-diamide synthase [Paracidobacterium acidisoli]
MIAFMVAGTASGVGKTTAALAMMAALRERGLAVQPFKCGPDFLDAGHHSAVCGRVSRNLDTWMLSAEANRDIFHSASQGADAAIVEGMMGLYDGVAGGGEAGSSAEIAKLLNLPVVLVLDASKSARSIAAVTKGFEVFDRDLRFAGIVLNGVNSEGHYRLLEAALSSSTGIPLLGRLPKQKAVSIPERHLGLRTAEEETAPDARREALAAMAREHLQLEPLLRLQHAAEIAPAPVPLPAPIVRYGVTRDQAFSFCYEDNLDLLRRAGAEIVPFSPLSDAHLPGDLDGLYLCGGYPELYADRLHANASMMAEIRAFAESGRPVYAECGGMLYLSQGLRSADGQIFPMTGMLPMRFEMTNSLVRFGYADVEFTGDCLPAIKGATARGHSFHYSQMVEDCSLPSACRVKYSLSGRTEDEGFQLQNVYASYIHLHFGSCPSIAESLVRSAAVARRNAEVLS